MSGDTRGIRYGFRIVGFAVLLVAFVTVVAVIFGG